MAERIVQGADRRYRITIDADPNAEAFYLACGVIRVGHVAAPIFADPSRVRPQLSLPISTSPQPGGRTHRDRATTSVLFICSQNRLRSPTAEQVFSNRPGYEVTSAGLSPEAEVPVTPELVEWADCIFVMEQAHRVKLADEFGKYIKSQRVVCLGIPDIFGYMDPRLVNLPEKKVGPFFNVGGGRRNR